MKFKEGDLVLIKTNPISDTLNRVTVKFCEPFEGPYVINGIKGDATYEMVDVDKPGSIRGIFNVRQLKPYPVSYTHLDVYKRQEMGIMYLAIEYFVLQNTINNNKVTYSVQSEI